MIILIIMIMKIISNFMNHSLSGDHYQEDYQDGYYDDLDDPDPDRKNQNHSFYGIVDVKYADVKYADFKY